MTYNLHGTQDGYTGENGPLCKSLNDTGTNTFLNVVRLYTDTNADYRNGPDYKRFITK